MNLATRLFAGTALVLLVAVTTLFLGMRGPLREDLEAALGAELERQARLVAVALEERPSSLNAAAHRLGGLLDRRVTLIGEGGSVLGDSEFDEASLRLLDNHLTRREVVDALAGGVGVARRVSASTHRPELKVAIGAWPGVVRVSASLAEVDAAVQSVQGTIAIAALVALLVAAGVTAVSGRAVSRSLRELARTVRGVVAGESPDYPVSSVPEIRDLVAALRGMQQELGAQMAALRRERDESGAIVESMGEGVIAADAKGKVLTANAAVRRLLAYGPDERLPNLRALFHQREARAAVDEILAGSDVEGREVQLDARPLLLTGRSLPNGAAVLVVRDMSALKRLDAVRRDFVANVSHELKTPLTSISGYTETLLGESPEAATRKQFLEVILANARRMQHLVDDLLDLARIESGQWQVQPRSTDVATAAREAFAAFAERAAQRGLGFNVEASPGTAAWVDPEAFRQMLDNLFDNSVRHTPRGGRILVTARRDHDTVEVVVQDTGSGIPHEHLGRVFERFYRADPGRSRQEGGTGLGLAIVKHLVEAHGGTVSIDSAVGRGTTVRMRFPYRPDGL